MLNKNQYKNITWIDLEKPTQDEVRGLIEEYSLLPIVADELLSPTIRPKVDVTSDFIYLILHFPTAHSHKEKGQNVRQTIEIDFIIGKDFIITAHYDNIDELHNFSKVFEVNSILDRSDMNKHAGFMFFYMIQHLYKVMMNKVENVDALLDDVESKIFEGHEKDMVIEISRLNRILLTFNESMSTHKEVLESFEIAGEQFFGNEFRYHLRSILGEYYKVSGAIQNARDYLVELRETNDSLLSTKQNEIMKVLTIMAFTTFPLSVVAGIFGMNAVDTPVIGSPGDFWIIITFMVALTAIFYLYFRYRKWL